MRNRTLSCTLALVMVLSFATACGPREEATMDDAETMGEDRDLNAFRERLSSAFASADAGGLAQLFTEDAVLIPSVGHEVRGRQAIEQTYNEVWSRWQVAQFELSPEEGKIARDWAFERGTMTIQMLPRDSAAAQQLGQAGGQQGQAGQQPRQPTGQAETQGRAGSQPQPGAGGGAAGGAMLMSTSNYVFVMNKQTGDWRISWFISTNPPEFSTSVTSDAPPGASTRPSR